MYNLDFKNGKSCVGIALIAVLALGAVWIGVDVSNKIKEGRYIGFGIQGNSVTVSGVGEVFVKPDLAQTFFSVVTEAKTVGQALSGNTEKMNAVISFIKGQGVEAKDLKTTAFNIYPRYEYQRVETDIYPYPPGKRVLVGYEVSQSLQVKVRDLTKVGTIIEGAAQAGANQIGDLQFTVDKEDEFKKQAREQAITQAKDKAKELASQLGIKLVRVINFSEGVSSPIFFGKEMAMSPSGGGSVPQVETGENKIQVQISITYEIN
ncbi:MAG: SIMPL domain-containing protein [bacterium]|nr:SIMPL domain-containing protein [bacterium]